MNYIIIYGTVYILKYHPKVIRIFFASALGAFFAIVSVMQIIEVLNLMIVKIVFSLVMIYIAASPKSFKELIKVVLVFYLVSFTFGGIALALLYFLKPENILMRNGVYIGTYPIKIIFLGAVLGYILISIVYSIIKNKYNKKRKICEIEVCINENKKILKALIDSGNLLKEPITGMPVIIVETTYLFGMVPKQILENLEKILLGNFNILENENTEEQDFISSYINKFRVIPFNSLGKENGILLGLIGDYIKVINNEEIGDKRIEKIIIGLYDKKLSTKRRI